MILEFCMRFECIYYQWACVWVSCTWLLVNAIEFPLLALLMHCTPAIVDGDCSPEIKRHLLLGRHIMTCLNNILKIRHHTVHKGAHCQSHGVSNSDVWMWELDYELGRVQNSRRIWTLVLEETLESPLDGKKSEQIHNWGPECSLEELILRQKLKYLGHVMRRHESWRRSSWWGKWKASGEEEDRGWDG